MLCVLSFSVAWHAFSQVRTDYGGNRSHVQLGMSFIELKERSLNNALHTGPGIYGAWILERAGSRSLKQLDLNLAAGFLKSDFEDEISSNVFAGTAGFSLLKNFCAACPDLNFYMGGKVRLASAIEYFDNWDESHFYWNTAYSAGVDFLADYSFRSGRKISIEGEMPLISLVSRPPDGISFSQSSPYINDVLADLNSDPGVMLPSGFLDLNFEVKYSAGERSKLMPSLFWRFHFLNVDKIGSGKLETLEHTLGIEYIF